MLYSINYDLKQPGRNYSALYNEIKSLGSWAHALESTWLVNTNLNAQGIWQRLNVHIDKNDNVLIAGVTSDRFWSLPGEVHDWLSKVTV